MNRKNNVSPKNIIIGFVVLNLLVGIFIVHDYGFSTDEGNDRTRSELAFNLFSSNLTGDPADLYEEIGLMQYYGTGSSVLFRFAEQYIFPNNPEIWHMVGHYGYFFFFQLAVLGIYLLSKFFLDEWGSLAAAILFGTQPLLFGHAFINPKDIPLLTVFLLSVLTGFNMVEGWREAESTRPNQKNHRIRFLVILMIIFLFFTSWRTVSGWVLDLVNYSYNTQETSIPGRIFALTTSSGSLEGYQTLAANALWRGHLLAVFTAPLILIGLFRWSGKNQIFGSKVNLTMLLASAVWGIAISTRVVAIAAGGIVLIYALAKYRQRETVTLGIYILGTMIFTYITWPFLWSNGYPGLIKSLTIIGDFPWEGQVLFEGQILSQGEIPARYLPKLMAIQFTEPLVIFSTIGILISFLKAHWKRIAWLKISLLLAWFLLPLIFTIIQKSTNYSNFRQYLFITPPLFIFAGIAIEFMASKIKNKIWVSAAFILILIPALFSIVKLHPYQYLYYNSFIGGVRGASGNYPLDYWNTAYKEAMDFVNQEAPEGSKILVWKNNQLGKVYAEKDFTFEAHTSVPVSEYENYPYAIIPILWHADISDFSHFPVVYAVMVDSVELVRVVKISN